MVRTGSPPHITAAVVRQRGRPFAFENLQIEEPRPHELLVRIVATGMCHADLVVRDGVFPVPLPLVPGHEGAGVVERVGAAVTKVIPGDHVILSFMSCGQCHQCVAGSTANCEHFNTVNFSGMREDGTSALHDGQGSVGGHFFGQSSFATYSLANERNVVKVPSDLPLDVLAPLGCGIQTGAGAIIHSLQVRTGDSLVVFGCGAVGLSAVLASRVVGATTIIGVDVIPARLNVARELGATHVVNSNDPELMRVVFDITRGGARFALDTTGHSEVIRTAVGVLAQRGVAGVLGAAPVGADFHLDINDFVQKAKTLRGIVEGDSVPDIFIPQLIEMYRQGRFPFDRLIRHYDFQQINEAARDTETGAAIKPVIRISPAGSPSTITCQ